MADPADPAADPQSDKTFTQADVDRIVQERVARAKTTPPDDYEDLKAKAQKFDELEQANSTELDKQKAAREKAERERDDALASVKESRLAAAVIGAAAKKNIVDPDAALALLDRSTLTLDDAGTPTNVDEALTQLLEAKPYLAATNGGRRGNADQGAREGGGTGKPGVAEGSLTDILLRSTERA